MGERERESRTEKRGERREGKEREKRGEGSRGKEREGEGRGGGSEPTHDPLRSMEHCILTPESTD